MLTYTILVTRKEKEYHSENISLSICSSPLLLHIQKATHYLYLALSLPKDAGNEQFPELLSPVSRLPVSPCELLKSQPPGGATVGVVQSGRLTPVWFRAPLRQHSRGKSVCDWGRKSFFVVPSVLGQVRV